MNDLAIVYYKLGQFGHASELLEDVVRLRSASLAGDHFETLTAMSNLAGCYVALGDARKAVRIGERALKLSRAKLGPEHPTTLLAMNNLGVSYYRIGQLSSAQRLLQETWAIRRRTLGADHPTTLTTMHNVATVHRVAGEVDRAIEIYLAELDLWRQRGGHQDMRMTIERLASTYVEAERFEDGRQMTREWIDLLQGREIPVEEATARVLMAEALLQLGQVEASMSESKKAIDLLSQDAPQHYELPHARSLLGTCMATLKLTPDAIDMVIESYRMLKAQLPYLKPDLRWYVPRACQRIIKIYEAAGLPDEANTYRAELNEILAEIDSMVSVE